LAQFMDYREVTGYKGDSADIHRLAKSNPFAPDSRRVLVATADLTFGMGRMYQVMLKGGGDTFHVCRDLDEGFEWVGLAGEQAAILDRVRRAFEAG
ncbi:MAG: hypothetical protein ACRENQ_11120, partial [Gemmatimonadaceae bacterium]